MGSHSKSGHFIHLQGDISINHVICKYITGLQEVTISVQGLQRTIQAATEHLT